MPSLERGDTTPRNDHDVLRNMGRDRQPTQRGDTTPRNDHDVLRNMHRDRQPTQRGDTTPGDNHAILHGMDHHERTMRHYQEIYKRFEKTINLTNNGYEQTKKHIHSQFIRLELRYKKDYYIIKAEIKTGKIQTIEEFEAKVSERKEKFERGRDSLRKQRVQADEKYQLEIQTLQQDRQQHRQTWAAAAKESWEYFVIKQNNREIEQQVRHNRENPPRNVHWHNFQRATHDSQRKIHSLIEPDI